MGPILYFENNISGPFAGAFSDLRVPEFFNFSSNNNTLKNTMNYYDSDSRMKTPGKNGFVRLAGQSSLKLNSLSWPSWTFFTLVFRINTMPVNDFFLQIGTGTSGVFLFLSPINGSTAVVNYYTGFGGANTSTGNRTNVQLSQGTWYMCVVSQNGNPTNALTYSFIDLQTATNRSDAWYNTGDSTKSFTVSNNNSAIYANPSSCALMLGTDFQAMLGVDVAWWHFFNIPLSGGVTQRDANNDWLLTLPSS
jgi:hypothetical protein